jgi:sugar (pentulose or hexulose) kinase
MSRQYLMGLDLGGGGGRCLLVDVESGEMTIADR